MLGWRLLISAFLIPSLIGLFWLDARLGREAWILFAFCLFVAVRNAFELTVLLKTRNMKPSFPVSAGLSLLVVCSGWVHLVGNADQQPAAALVSLGLICGTLVIGFCGLMARECSVYEKPGNSMESLGAHAIIVMYAGGLLAVTAQFRWFPKPEFAYFAIGSMIIAVKCGDTGAYTFGRLWGKRKMAPVLSPGKTWMGFVGALAGSIVGGCLWLMFAGAMFEAKPQVQSLLIAVLYSASMGVIGLIGDLCESLIKRDVEKKDSAALMPGFGGLLDLLDSPLYAGPFALLWWHLIPPAWS
ncbi:MAG: CDP-archaeol synthase [Planctomyces sp.]|nr:CDP-archaeol synthase [Planctomyces sp.]